MAIASGVEVGAAPRLFGTDGIRGRTGIFPVTTDGFYRLGYAFALYAARDSATPVVLVGRDTRLSGPELEDALTRGLQAGGARVQCIGVVPTSTVALLTVLMGYDGGAIVTASHNPASDNGLKFFDRSGAKVGIEAELAIEDFAFASSIDSRPAAFFEHAAAVPDLVEVYVDFLRSSAGAGASFAGLRLVIDASNGAAGRVARLPFEALGCRVELIGAAADGAHINDGVGALHPEAMASYVCATGADLGVAFDGDADRAVFADGSGQPIEGDLLLGALATDLLRTGQLRAGAVVGTVLSNRGLERYLSTLSVALLRAPVGDRNIFELMRTSGSNLGGEASGHYLLTDYLPVSDGLLSCIQVMAAMARAGKSLSVLCGSFEPTPQVAINLRLSRPLSDYDRESCRSVAASASKLLGKSGTAVVRPSGTEPLIRVLVDADDVTIARRVAENAAKDLQTLMEQPAK